MNARDKQSSVKKERVPVESFQKKRPSEGIPSESEDIDSETSERLILTIDQLVQLITANQNELAIAGVQYRLQLQPLKSRDLTDSEDNDMPFKLLNNAQSFGKQDDGVS